MKRAAQCVLSCVLLCCFLLSFTCSAVDFSVEGYEFDEEGYFWYQKKSFDDIEDTIGGFPARAPARAAVSNSFNFVGFDKNKIDVTSFPSKVQNVLSSPTSIVFLIVLSDSFYIWVADGCIPCVSTTNGKLFLMNLKLTNSGTNINKFLSDGTNNFTIYPQSFVCFSAVYSWSHNDDIYVDVVDDWDVSTSKLFDIYVKNDSGKWETSGAKYYTYEITSSLSKKVSDFFVFGNNNYFRSDMTSIHYPFKDKAISYAPGVFSDSVSRYNSWISEFSSGSSNFSMIFGGAFPTAESQQAETQRGILGQLKALPDKIKAFFDSLFDKIKGLFIPSDGFFDTYFSDLKTFFAERFGFIYDLPAAAVTIFNQLVSFKPAESGYHIHFPEVSAPVIMEGISGVGWQRIIPEQDYYFDFLDKAPFSTLYSGYRAFIWLAYCFMLVNLAKSKADSILGGK